MGRRNQKVMPEKAQYVRGKKNKGAPSSLVAKRVLAVVIVLVFMGLMVWGIVLGIDFAGRKFFSENPRFELQHLEIMSNGSRVSEDFVRECIGFAEGTNIFAVHFSEIEAVFSEVPLVESVELNRELPHTLRIEISERWPVARIQKRPAFTIDRNGYVLPPSKSSAHLPLIRGLGDLQPLPLQVSGADMENALTIIALFDGVNWIRNVIQVEQIELKHQDYIELYLKGYTRVYLPRYSFKSKLRDLVEIMKDAESKGKRVKKVDLTLDSLNVIVEYY